MRERRQVLGLTQEMLAEKAGTSTQYIGQIELKNKFPSTKMLESIAKALEVDTLDLFSVPTTPSENIRRFKKTVLTDLEEAVENIVAKHLRGLD